MARYAEELSDGNPFLPDETIEFLCEYDWPGNVRELENAVKRTLVLASGDVLQPEDFAFLHRETAPGEAGGDLAQLVREEVSNALERAERPLIETVLAHTDGNQIRAAALLGINRNTLRKKIVDLDVDIPGRK